MRRYYARAPGGCNIGWLRIHLIRGTCKALPSYGALLKATTVTADFVNLVTAALICHVCTCPRYLRESVGRNKRTTHSDHFCASDRGGIHFSFDKQYFCARMGAKSMQSTTQTQALMWNTSVSKEVGFKHQLSATDIQLAAITAGGGEKGHRGPNCTIDVKQICVHTQTKSWRAGRL